MDKFKNKYRISSTRLQSWNYGANGAYFITICTHKREHFFGKIINGEMKLNDLGELAESEWIKTIELRPDMNLEMGAFVIMPNHFHAIIIIGDNEYNRTGAMHCACASNKQNKFGSQSKNLASIIRGFKSSITTNARKLGNSNFAWQTRFHDHIIRNGRSFENIQNYIINNPKKWQEDTFQG